MAEAKMIVYLLTFLLQHQSRDGRSKRQKLSALSSHSPGVKNFPMYLERNTDVSTLVTENTNSLWHRKQLFQVRALAGAGGGG